MTSQSASAESKTVVLLIKGHPCIGKTTLAHSLGRRLRWPVLCKDDIRDHAVICDARANALLQKLNCVSEKIDTNELCYDVMFQLAETQLACGLSVILESPFAHERLYKKALQLADRFQGALVCVLDCYLDDTEWMKRLEKRAAATLEEDKQNIANGSSERINHRPQSWQDIEQLLQKYRGCFNYQIDPSTKIVLDMAKPVSKNVQHVLSWLEQQAGYKQQATCCQKQKTSCKKDSTRSSKSVVSISRSLWPIAFCAGLLTAFVVTRRASNART